MERRLTNEETKRALHLLGIDRPFASTFGISDASEDVRYNFHHHRQHQLLLPGSGLLFVETKNNFYVCSPQIGLWIPAGVSHATTTKTKQTLSCYFNPAKFSKIAEAPAMIRMTPLLREAMKDSVSRKDDSQGYASAVFQMIHGVAAENVLEKFWPSIPMGSSDFLKRAIDVVMHELSAIFVHDLAKKTGQSERSMRRRFLKELGIGPEQFIQRARLLRAMQLLVEHSGRTITEIGLEVGYSNHSAFTSAFQNFTGLTPTLFRRANV